MFLDLCRSHMVKNPHSRRGQPLPSCRSSGAVFRCGEDLLHPDTTTRLGLPGRTADPLTPKTAPTDRQSYGSPISRVCYRLVGSISPIRGLRVLDRLAVDPVRQPPDRPDPKPEPTGPPREPRGQMRPRASRLSIGTYWTSPQAQPHQVVEESDVR